MLSCRIGAALWLPLGAFSLSITGGKEGDSISCSNLLFPWCLLKHLIILCVTCLAQHRFESVSSDQMKENLLTTLPLLPLLL